VCRGGEKVCNVNAHGNLTTLSGRFELMARAPDGVTARLRVLLSTADFFTQGVIPGTGHWLIEEASVKTIVVIREFIAP